MKKIVFGTVIIAGIFFAAWMLYNKPHRSVADEDSITVQASNLFNAYQNNEAEANQAYLNKVLEVSGKVSSITSNSEGLPIIMLASADPIFGINCTMDNNIQNISVGDSIVIRGICTGYLSDVVLIQCQLQQEK